MRKAGIAALILLFSLWAGPALGQGQAAAPPSQEAVNGFFVSAFQAEYGGTGRAGKLIRWEIPLTLFVQGEYTPKDMQVIAHMLEGLGEHVPGLPEISFAPDKESANVCISFAPYLHMAEYLESYASGNWGFVNCFSDDASIRRGLIAVASDVTGQQERNQIIQEEFFNLLGLLNDLPAAPQSIIYQHHPTAQSPAPMDYEMLTLLYSSRLQYGMTAPEALAALQETYPGLSITGM